MFVKRPQSTPVSPQLPKVERRPELSKPPSESLRHPDIIELTHVQSLKPTASAQVFPTVPKIDTQVISRFQITAKIREAIHGRTLTISQLRSFLTGDSGITVTTVVEALNKFNEAGTPSPDQAGLFLTDKTGSPIKIEVGFARSERTAQARFCYDLAGKLEMRLDSRIIQGSLKNLSLSWFNEGLKPTQIQSIEQLAAEVENDNHYSTLAVPLAFCRYARLAAQRGELLNFSETHQFFSSHGEEVIACYKGAACMTLAEVLRDKIIRRVGVQAYVLTQPSLNGAVLWPKLDGSGTQENVNAYELLGPHQHADVVVPYLVEGEFKIMFIVVGEGTEFGTTKDNSENRRDPFDLTHINHLSFDPESTEFFENYLGREFAMANPERLAAQAIRCKSTILMKHAKTGAIFGLDLVAGHAFMGSSGLETLNRIAGIQDTVKKIIPLEKKSELTKMLGIVEQIYGLDEEFSDDVIFLAENRERYLKEVLLPPAATLAQCYTAFSKAIRLTKVRDDLIRPFGTIRSISMISDNKSKETLKKAADAVRASKPEDARALYESAAKELQDDIERLQTYLSP